MRLSAAVGRAGLALGATAAAVAMVVACATASVTVELPGQEQPAAGIVVIVHGVAGHSDGWPLRLEHELRGRGASGELWDVYRVEWHEASLNRLAAPRTGYELGRRIGTELLELRPGYEVIHLVGHSVGAVVVQGITDALTAGGPRTESGRPVVFQTFLDPFVARPPLRLRWGVRRLGEGADFAESYVTREDQIPFTNSLLHRAHNFDLTSVLPHHPDPPGDYAHVWPITFYQESSHGSDLGLDLAPSRRFAAGPDSSEAREYARALRDRYPPGATTVP